MRGLLKSAIQLTVYWRHRRPYQYVIFGASLGVVIVMAHLLLFSRAAPTPLLGVDTSHFQVALNVSQAKSQGIVYQFMKATQGTGFSDPLFASSRSSAVAGGLIPGAYHFLEAGNGAAQCDYFINRLNATGGTSGIMLGLDVELQNSTTGPSYQDVLDFLNRCKAQTPGRTWVVYTGAWYWGSAINKGYLGNPAAPVGTVLWVSKYVSGLANINTLLGGVVPQGTAGEPYAAAPINGWPQYYFRQFSSTASVANINTVDADVTYMSMANLQLLAGMSGPDLSVTNLTWTPNPAVVGGVTFSATVKNQGNGAYTGADNLGIGFYVGSTEMSWFSGKGISLQPGESRTFTANGGGTGNGTWNAAAGSYTAKAYVDDLNLIAELNEANNTLSVPMVVANSPTPAPTSTPAPSTSPKPTPVPVTTPSPTQPTTPGDANGDGRVNASDLSMLISHSGQAYAPADFNGDGTVDAPDMAILLSRWTW